MKKTQEKWEKGDYRMLSVRIKVKNGIVDGGVLQHGGQVEYDRNEQGAARRFKLWRFSLDKLIDCKRLECV